MSLLERQIAFREEIAAPDDATPPSSLGMEIYRNAYRGRLLAALEVSFERTRRWAGEEAFAVAACHYILTNPPTGWTLDEYGADFPELLAALFAADPEVAELAWLEWQMQRAFAANDMAILDAKLLATAGYTEADWAAMRFEMAAGFATKAVATNCTDLWAALSAGEATDRIAIVHSDAALLVWRSELSPRYRLTTVGELSALKQLAEGATLATIAHNCAVESLGEWLAQWLTEGIFARAIPSTAEPKGHN